MTRKFCLVLALITVTALSVGCASAGSSAADITTTAATTASATTATAAGQGIGIEGLTIDDLPTVLFDVATVDWENDKIWLIAELPEQDIRLYGLNFSADGSSTDKGTVLVRWKDRFFKYAWDFLTPRAILPILGCADYDTDNELEIAVDLYVGSGTGLSIEQLHILDYDGTDVLRDYRLDEQKYLDAFNDKLQWSLNNSTKVVTVNMGESVATFNLDSMLIENQMFEKIGISGNIVSYMLEGGKLSISLAFGPLGGDYDIFGPYIGDASADIQYRNGDFEFSNMMVKMFENY